jgi:hypothetical protein
MRRQRAHWAVPSRMLTHNAWHLAMFELDGGHVAAALSILDRCILPAVAQSPVDACDAVSLLWRVAAHEPRLGGQWRQLSAVFQRCWKPGFWPYVDLHAALAHLRAGHQERFDILSRGVAECALGTHTVAARAREVTVPLLRSLAAHNGEVRANTAAAITELGPLLDAAGGSRLQRGVFGRAA